MRNDEGRDEIRRIRVEGKDLAPGKTVSIPLSLPHPASWRVWLRMQTSASSARVTLQGLPGPSLEMRVSSGLGKTWVPVHEESTGALSFLGNGGETKPGALLLRGEGGNAAALAGPSLIEGKMEATFALGSPPRKLRGESPGAFFFLSENGLRSGVAAGFALNPSRFLVRLWKDGKAQTLTETPAAIETEKAHSLRLEIERGKLRLFEGNELRVESDIPDTMRQCGWLASQCEVRVRAVSIEELGRPLYANSFTALPKEIPLPAGETRLEVQALDPGVSFDAVLMAPSANNTAPIAPQRLRFVRTAHFDLFGRPPREVEALAASRMEVAEMAQELVASPEFWRRWFEEELYFFLLIDNFRPSGDLLRSVPARLTRGEIHVKEALWQICICPEFNARNPGADTFVTVVLEQLLGLTVQKQPSVLEAGKKLYDGYPGKFLGKEGRSQSDVVKAIFEHTDFPAFYLQRLYQRLLGEPMAAGKRKEWSDRFAADPRQLAALVTEWLCSESYARRAAQPQPKNDSMFIESLFQDLLLRPPTQQEHRNLFNALQALSDSSPIRMVLVKMILDSGKIALPEKEKIEFKPWLETWFLRFLARTPTPKEELAFAALWKDPQCTPKLVLQALATHPEYQVY